MRAVAAGKARCGGRTALGRPRHASSSAGNRSSACVADLAAACRPACGCPRSAADARARFGRCRRPAHAGGCGPARRSPRASRSARCTRSSASARDLAVIRSAASSASLRIADVCSPTRSSARRTTSCGVRMASSWSMVRATWRDVGVHRALVIAAARRREGHGARVGGSVRPRDSARRRSARGRGAAPAGAGGASPRARVTRMISLCHRRGRRVRAPGASRVPGASDVADRRLQDSAAADAAAGSGCAAVRRGHLVASWARLCRRRCRVWSRSCLLRRLLRVCAGAQGALPDRHAASRGRS